jgi:hypothetical protein
MYNDLTDGQKMDNFIHMLEQRVPVLDEGDKLAESKAALATLRSQITDVMGAYEDNLGTMRIDDLFDAGTQAAIAKHLARTALSNDDCTGIILVPQEGSLAYAHQRAMLDATGKPVLGNGMVYEAVWRMLWLQDAVADLQDSIKKRREILSPGRDDVQVFSFFGRPVRDEELFQTTRLYEELLNGYRESPDGEVIPVGWQRDTQLYRRVKWKRDHMRTLGNLYDCIESEDDDADEEWKQLKKHYLPWDCPLDRDCVTVTTATLARSALVHDILEEQKKRLVVSPRKYAHGVSEEWRVAMYKLRKRLLRALADELPREYSKTVVTRNNDQWPDHVNDGPDELVKHVARTAVESDMDGDVVIDFTDGQQATKKKRSSSRTGRPKCMSSGKYTSSAVTTGPGQSTNAGNASTSTPNSPLQSPTPCVGAWLAATYYQQPSSSGNDPPKGGVPLAVNNAPLTHAMQFTPAHPNNL